MPAAREAIALCQLRKSCVFVRDLTTNSITLVSTASNGTQGNGGSTPGISANGRYVVFASGADNLVSGDTNGKTDIFVKDLMTNTTTRVSTASDGTQGNNGSYFPAISADGRYVAFDSDADMVSGDIRPDFCQAYLSWSYSQCFYSR